MAVDVAVAVVAGKMVETGRLREAGMLLPNIAPALAPAPAPAPAPAAAPFLRRKKLDFVTGFFSKIMLGPARPAASALPCSGSASDSGRPTLPPPPPPPIRVLRAVTGDPVVDAYCDVPWEGSWDEGAVVGDVDRGGTSSSSGSSGVVNSVS